MRHTEVVQMRRLELLVVLLALHSLGAVASSRSLRQCVDSSDSCHSCPLAPDPEGRKCSRPAESAAEVRGDVAPDPGSPDSTARWGRLLLAAAVLGAGTLIIIRFLRTHHGTSRAISDVRSCLSGHAQSVHKADTGSVSASRHEDHPPAPSDVNTPHDPGAYMRSLHCDEIARIFRRKVTPFLQSHVARGDLSEAASAALLERHVGETRDLADQWMERWQRTAAQEAPSLSDVWVALMNSRQEALRQEVLQPGIRGA